MILEESHVNVHETPNSFVLFLQYKLSLSTLAVIIATVNTSVFLTHKLAAEGLI